MNDVQPENAGSSELERQISGSIASIWKRFAGSDPGRIETTFRGNVVRCVMNDVALEAPPIPTEGAEGVDPRLGSEAAYRRDGIASVARATGRPVAAFIDKHNTKSAVATAVFILDDRRLRIRG